MILMRPHTEGEAGKGIQRRKFWDACAAPIPLIPISAVCSEPARIANHALPKETK